MKKVISVYLKSICEESTNALNEKAVEVAYSTLTKAGVVAVPTDTIYGIAGLAQNNDVIDRIYRIKDRDKAKPIAICVSEIDEFYKWSKVTVPHSLLTDLLPGPVTVVFERSPALNNRLNPGTKLVGIRIPNNEFIRTVCRLCNSPLALSSANISSETSCISVEEFQHLWPSLDAVFDGGILKETDPNRLGSTVINLSVSGFYKIIREGCAFSNVKHILENKYSLKEMT
ncbi:yrdC domain-containing protein-like protein [Dinothrombium tinctorium]|uniref:Threonylcarbamoyl-AMP synthase n=1 Tax=Dinothrombium tinctorium TaxID=1965070 RepID=A0A443RQ77_9ACAR|nr:yrdC domain-containing protein-like protein [Dinothrombium tinctorium]